MNTKELAEELAALKTDIKSLEAQAKEVQEQLLRESDYQKEFKTSKGKLVLGSRETMECTDKEAAYKVLGKAGYLAVTNPSLPQAKKAFGEVMAEKLLSKDIFKLKSSTQYYTLRK
jgi:hypothetical protein